MNYFDQILKSINFLPPFPIVVTKAINLMRDPDVRMNEIAEVISTDQSIVANLLRFCNSSYVGLQRPIMNVRDAVTFVGMNYLKRMLIITGAQSYFKMQKPGYEAKAGELWNHSLAASLLSTRIEKLFSGVDSDNVFIASLLHDVGKLVLSEFVENEYERIRDMIEQEHISFIEAERKVIGTDHADIGFRILSLWRFRDEIAEAVLIHHSTVKPDDSPLANIVKLADIFSITMGYGTALSGLEKRELAEICQHCGINYDILDSISEEMMDEIKKVESEVGFTEQK